MTLVVGIAGGTGSGKTTLARALAERFAPNALLVEYDWYYRDQSAVSPEHRAARNYDHPDALETSLLTEHLRRLMAGESVAAPVYDFATHTRTGETRQLEPQLLILVEGIHALHPPELRRLFALGVYVDAPADIRFIRRLRRDLAERGRDVESVVRQYLEQVRPMHEQFVEPARRHAGLEVSGEDQDEAIEQTAAAIAELMMDKTGTD
jgi:uridine kinase